MNPTDPDSVEKWRVIRGKPKSEHLAAQHLRAAGFEAFCPRLRHQKKTVRGKVWYVEALFPGYLFARFSRLQMRHVASTAFVSQVLTFMEDCAAVPDGVVAELRTSVDEKETITVETAIQAGEQVEIVEGPMRGQSVTVTRVIPGAQRVRVLMEFLGSPHEVEVSILDLLSIRDPRAEALPPRLLA
jgi:transcriptional antiterminator RfaH